MMEPILQPFAEQVGSVTRGRPTIPFVSNLTGTWITEAEANSPDYWASHLRGAVRFADGIEELTKEDAPILLEVGPGTTLTSLARFGAPGAAIVSSLGHVKDDRDDLGAVLTALGRLWLQGVKIDWKAFHARERRHRIPLPTYPFQRERYFVEPRLPAAAPVAVATPAQKVAVTIPVKVVSAPAASEVERTLSKVWCDLLGRQEVGLEDNFFDLGGDSLLLLRVQAKIHEIFHVELSPAEMFEHTTIAALGKRLGPKETKSPKLTAAQSRAQMQRAAIGAAPRQTAERS